MWYVLHSPPHRVHWHLSLRLWNPLVRWCSPWASVDCHSRVQVVGFFPIAACDCRSVEKSLDYISGFLPPVFQESGALQGFNLVMGYHSSVQVPQQVVGFFLFVACHCGSVEKSLVYIS